MGAFKAYDIRGVYNKDFDKDTVYKIGYFLPGLLKTDRVLVGRDVRQSTPEVFEALTKGITDAGADVYDLGLATTPFVYYSTARFGFDASVQITASHNPKEYNGLKISRTRALPVGYETGLEELESLVHTGTVEPAEIKGEVIEYEQKEAYLEFLRGYVPKDMNLSLGIDISNGMASLFIRDLLGDSPDYIYEELDGTFPNHEPNPLEEENVEALKKLVKKNNHDLGIIFDGDADRVMFTDEKGNFISPDLIIGVLGHYFLEKEKTPVLHDIRTSKSVSEYIEKLGGTFHVWKVGHAFAKLKLAEIGASYGGELAGHYYFRDFYNCDSGILACLIVLQVVQKLKNQGRTISSLIDEIVRYSYSGEINFHIEEKDEAVKTLYDRYAGNAEKIYDFDGYRIEFPDWWFNVRKSNTEPYLRLVVEAKDDALLKEKVDELKEILGEFLS